MTVTYFEMTCPLCGVLISTVPGSVNRCDRPICAFFRIGFRDYGSAATTVAAPKEQQQ